jgi:MFS transporter, PAT family, beta-lactamase induction signal transducer AmpG
LGAGGRRSICPFHEHAWAVMATPRIAPVWLIGLSMSPFGFYGGILFYAVPQLLAARHVPEERIAGLTGMLILPGVLSFLIAPILDVRFSPRWYATACCALATAGLAAGLLNQTDLRLFGALLFVGNTFICLFGAALGGWLASVIPGDRRPALSSWLQVANIGARGLMAFLSVRLIRHFSLPVAVGLLACILLLPMTIFLLIPAPGPDRRLARESFTGLLRAISSLFRRSEVILVLLLFALPSSSFTLTNILGGLGGDFHTPERTVSLINGVGVTFAGIAASLLGGLCARTCHCGGLISASGSWAGCLRFRCFFSHIILRHSQSPLLAKTHFRPWRSRWARHLRCGPWGTGMRWRQQNTVF